jgi:hypothetical protein
MEAAGRDKAFPAADSQNRKEAVPKAIPVQPHLVLNLLCSSRKIIWNPDIPQQVRGLDFLKRMAF